MEVLARWKASWAALSRSSATASVTLVAALLYSCAKPEQRYWRRTGQMLA